MKKINFVKYQACGNDFVIVDNTKQNIELSKSDICNICNRYYGIGCNQLLLIDKIDIDKFFYYIFNQDGSESFQCVNGARCVIDFITKSYGIDNQTITLVAKNQKNYHGYIKDNATHNIILNIPSPYDVMFDLNYNDITYDYIDIGNPHAIVRLDNLEFNNIDIKNKIIKSLNLYYKDGININLYTKLNNDTIEILTHERGVGYTLSCGSGACATIYSITKGVKSNTNFKVISKGGNLEINIDKNIVVIGNAKLVFEGIISI